MKKTKLLVLVGAVLLISLLSVSGAWAGPAEQGTQPFVKSGDGGVVALPPALNILLPDAAQTGWEAASGPVLATTKDGVATEVCVPFTGSYRNVALYFLGGDGKWHQVSGTYVDGNQVCGIITVTSILQAQGF